MRVLSYYSPDRPMKVNRAMYEFLRDNDFPIDSVVVFGTDPAGGGQGGIPENTRSGGESV